MKRPWGTVQRILPRLGERTWSLIACSSFEERCLGTTRLVSAQIERSIFLRFDDAPSRFSRAIEEKTDRFAADLAHFYPDRALNQTRYRLLGPINDLILDLRAFLAGSGPRLIIDMSAMPKKALCLVLKEAMRADNIEDILVTYAIPGSYTESPLVEDLNPLSGFPGFSGDLGTDEPKRIVASLGYTPIDLPGLRQQLAGRPPVSTIFPFPPGAPGYQRNWQLLRRLFGDAEPIDTPIRVDAHDASYAFDVLKSVTNNGQEFSFLLPFGPKPHSLAMLLHSLQFGSNVQYTQPKIYNPEYSVGVKLVNDEPLVYAYCLKLESTNLYT